MSDTKVQLGISLLLIVTIIIGIISLSGCVRNQNQKTQISIPTSTSDKENVSIKNFAFKPALMTVKVGTTVTWTNEDSSSHTVTSTGNFDSGALDKGETFSYTFNKIGTFNYICTIHPNMKGKIIVEK